MTRSKADGDGIELKGRADSFQGQPETIAQALVGYRPPHLKLQSFGSMSDLSKAGNIQVSVRIRPLNVREVETGSSCAWSSSENALELSSHFSHFRGAPSGTVSFGNCMTRLQPLLD